MLEARTIEQRNDAEAVLNAYLKLGGDPAIRHVGSALQKMRDALLLIEDGRGDERDPFEAAPAMTAYYVKRDWLVPTRPALVLFRVTGHLGEYLNRRTLLLDARPERPDASGDRRRADGHHSGRGRRHRDRLEKLGMTKRRRHLPGSFAELSGLRARGYMRESTERQGIEGSGPEAQRDGIRAFATQYSMTLDTGDTAQFERMLVEATKPGGTKGGKVGDLYVDLISGSGHVARPQFDQMLRDAEAGQFDVLVVYDSTRFGRSMDKVGGWTDKLHEKGVCIAYYYDRVLSSDSSTGSLVTRAVGAAMSEDYRRRLGEKVGDGYRLRRFAKRAVVGLAPVGYRKEYQSVFNPTRAATRGSRPAGSCPTPASA